MVGYDRLFGFDVTQKQTLKDYVADEIASSGGGGTITSADITDASATGRSVLTGADAGAIRTTLSALATNGSGASLTALNATQLTTGTVPVARLPNATTAARGVVLQGVAVANAAAAPTQAEFNALLASLRTAGVLAT